LSKNLKIFKTGKKIIYETIIVTPVLRFFLIIFIINVIKHQVSWLIKSSRFRIRIQSHEFEFEVSSSIYCGLIYSVSKFLEFIGVELDLTLKREFVPHDMFYNCEKLKKLWRSESFYFKGPNRANQLSFRLGTDFIQLLLNDYLYCKFHIFFDIEIWCVPVTQTIVQSLDITMEQFLSKVEL
jgi:hypothetical protein